MPFPATRDASIDRRHTGVLKTAAKRLGMSFDDYLARINAGDKWCTFGKHWAQKAIFPPDSHRPSGKAQACAPCLDIYHRQLPKKKRPAPKRVPGQTRAVHAVNHAICRGEIANPNTLACVHCGHAGQDRRHEYHHHNGYEFNHRLDVISLCSKCHKRETRRAMGLATFTPPEVLLAISSN